LIVVTRLSALVGFTASDYHIGFFTFCYSTLYCQDCLLLHSVLSGLPATPLSIVGTACYSTLYCQDCLLLYSVLSGLSTTPLSIVRTACYSTLYCQDCLLLHSLLSGLPATPLSTLHFVIYDNGFYCTLHYVSDMIINYTVHYILCQI
jgi:hypothetical protein